MSTVRKMDKFSIFASSPYAKVQFKCVSYELVGNTCSFFLMSCLNQINFTPLKSDFLLHAHFFFILKCQINFDVHPSITI